MGLGGCLCSQVAPTGAEPYPAAAPNPGSRAATADAIGSRPGVAHRPGQAPSQHKVAFKNQEDPSTRRGVAFAASSGNYADLQQMGQTQGQGSRPHSSSLRVISPGDASNAEISRPRGPSRSTTGGASARFASASRPVSANTNRNWASSVGTLSAASAVSRYYFTDDGDGSGPEEHGGDDEHEHGPGYPSEDQAYEEDDMSRTMTGVTVASSSHPHAGALSTTQRIKSNVSTWSVKMMSELQLMPDHHGRLRLPSILMFTQRRPPRHARTEAWWTKIKGVLVEAGQNISASVSEGRQRRHGTTDGGSEGPDRQSMGGQSIGGQSMGSQKQLPHDAETAPRAEAATAGAPAPGVAAAVAGVAVGNAPHVSALSQSSDAGPISSPAVEASQPQACSSGSGVAVGGGLPAAGAPGPSTAARSCSRSSSCSSRERAFADHGPSLNRGPPGSVSQNARVMSGRLSPQSQPLPPALAFDTESIAQPVGHLNRISDGGAAWHCPQPGLTRTFTEDLRRGSAVGDTLQREQAHACAGVKGPTGMASSVSGLGQPRKAGPSLNGGCTGGGPVAEESEWVNGCLPGHVSRHSVLEG